MDDARPIVSREREWVATIATYLTTEKRHADDLAADAKRAVAPGARLAAVPAGEQGFYWRIIAPVLDGVRLPPATWFLDREHWTLLPKAAPVAHAEPQADLTASRLTAATWSFGMPGEAPWSKKYIFEAGGKMSGLTGEKHKSWRLEDGTLKIFSEAGALTFISDVVTSDSGSLKITGFRLLAPKVAPLGVLTEIPAAATAPGEIVKLVIWDLDETFWHGTLSEGGITPIARNIEIVKELTARGIVNSICSKNDFERTKIQLIELGIWDYFIFPKIAFAPKGAMIADIIDSAQLRAASVLFIDDNKMNLNEALHYNPGLQVCEPDGIAGLLANPACAGKPDPEHTRLARYKVLEKKAFDQEAAGKDNLEFLRASDIRVSFHHDVMAEFPRIHDLVNRTNQLNFTKRRWPEDIEVAREAFAAAMAEHFNSHAGYIKVADRYGNYGIVGFYFLQNDACTHYLFSCRTLNMGIEQFVWQRLGKPKLKIVGEVVASLGDDPDWITVVDDADIAAETTAAGAKPTICVRGACDLRQMTHYLRTKFNTIEEFPYPYKRWSIYPVARAAALYEEATSPAGRALIEKLTFLPPDRFHSAIHTGEADIYMLSFPMEVLSGLYRSKSTGMIFPFSSDYMGYGEFSALDYDKIADRAATVGMTRQDWEFLQNEFTFFGGLDEAQLAADVEKIFRKLQGKLVVVLMLNETVGQNRWLLERWGRINTVIRPLAKAFGYHIVELSEFVRSPGDLTSPSDYGAHFNRQVYQKLAARMTELVANAKITSPVLEPA